MEKDSIDVRGKDRMDRVLVTLSRSLSMGLFHDNEEVVLETVRALGN